jgi:SAM-dependent methyltransferase
MGDKYAGGLAGGGAASAGAELEDAVASAALHETLVPGVGPALRVIVSRRHGGVALLPCDAAAAARRAVAASQMRSMLADDARCAKYAAAIERAVARAGKAKGEAGGCSGVRVVDIGAGTGLLGMLAARAGAVQVDAVEMFAPLADVAKEIVVGNGLEGKVAVYGGHKSTDMSVEEDERYDVVVSEIVDSALLGEGILPVLAHAREALLTEGAISVPAAARVFGQVVESPALFARWHSLDGASGENGNAGFPFFRSDTARRCNGGSRIFPVHLGALQAGRDYTPLSDVFPVLSLDFSAPPPQAHNTILQIKPTRVGIPHAVILWWELDLSGDGSHVYSTRPGAEPWQDHWLQGVFPLPQAAAATITSTATLLPLHVGHTPLSLYFSLSRARSPRLCSCGFHTLRGSGPARIAALADPARGASLRRRAAAAVMAAAKPTVRVLDISTASSVAGLLAAEAATDACRVDVTSLETEDEEDSLECLLYRQVAEARARDCPTRKRPRSSNRPQSPPTSSFMMAYSIAALEEAASDGNILYDVLVAEPYHPSMQNYPTAVAASLWLRRAALATLVSPTVQTVPARGSIRAQLLSFADDTLHRSFQAARSVLGLDHGALDAAVAVEKAADGTGYEAVSLPLYMYVHRALSEAAEIYSVVYADMPPAGVEKRRVELVAGEGGRVDAVKIWAEFDGEKMGREEQVEVLWLDEAVNVAEGDAVVVECRWDRDTLGGFGFRVE